MSNCVQLSLISNKSGVQNFSTVGKRIMTPLGCQVHILDALSEVDLLQRKTSLWLNRPEILLIPHEVLQLDGVLFMMPPGEFPRRRRDEHSGSWVAHENWKKSVNEKVENVPNKCLLHLHIYVSSIHCKQPTTEFTPFFFNLVTESSCSGAAVPLKFWR